MSKLKPTDNRPLAINPETNGANAASGRITIVTPCFNHVRFIRATIESVLSQNYSNLEYIVIDGGSTDGSAEIIKEYEPRLSFFVSEKDTGHGNALNKGFKRSTGEIMAWLNSDDKHMPRALQTVATIFQQHPDVNWIVGTNGWWNDQGTMVSTINVFKNLHDFLSGDFAWIQQESVFWRRSLWEKAGGTINEDYKLMVDGELWTRFFLHDELYHAHCLLSGYRMHSANRAAQRYSECVSEMRRAIDAVRPEALKVAARRSNAYPTLIYDHRRGIWTKGVCSRECSLQLEAMRDQLAAMQNSTSWRITAPLRAAIDFIHSIWAYQ